VKVSRALFRHSQYYSIWSKNLAKNIL